MSGLFPDDKERLPIRIFQLSMLVVLAFGYLLIEKFGVDRLAMLIVFFSLFIAGLITVWILKLIFKNKNADKE